MDQENTAIFSRPSRFMSHVHRTKEICPIHHIHLSQVFGRKPICLECEKEKINQQEQEFLKQAESDIERYKVQGWLSNRSIYLDKTLSEATFDNYKTNDDETTRNKEKALEIAREYFKEADFNTIFTGKPGAGKSHLSMAMLKVINDNADPYKKCLFIAIDELMRRIRGSYGDKDSPYSEQKMVKLMLDADILVLDDLGAETGAINSSNNASDFTIKILYSILNGRMKKPTIFTTNLSSKELERVYDAKLISRMMRGVKGHIIAFKETADKRLIEF